MWILGLAGSHNAAAALIKDGRVVVAVQAERLTRVKRQPIALEHMGADAGALIAYCLRAAGIELGDLHAIATSTPGPARAPAFALAHGDPQIARALPAFVTVPHHLAHAEYALHYSRLEPGLVLVCDGSGTYEDDRPSLDVQELLHPSLHRQMAGERKEAVSAYVFDGLALRLAYRLAPGTLGGAQRPQASAGKGWLASLGHLWEWAALYCHGSRHEAGKVMGLAPFGDPSVHEALCSARFDREAGLAEIDFVPLMRILGQPNTGRADVSGQAHFAHVAAHVQRRTDEFLSGLAQWLRARHDTSRFYYSGGVALNGITNEHLCRGLGLELHMNGSCEDNGTAIGAALAAHQRFTGERIAEPVEDCLGREYADDEILQALRAAGVRSTLMERDDLLRHCARALAVGRVLGWFQGRSEFGPRALGRRSILADPRDPRMQRRLNEQIKHREGFRPYAPAVLEHRASEFFELGEPSPSMLRVVRTRGPRLPATTHVDGTARVQTIRRDQHPMLHDLLIAFDREAGVPVLLNTSFNVAGEPIVESPGDALSAFRSCRLDALVLGRHWVAREEASS